MKLTCVINKVIDVKGLTGTMIGHFNVKISKDVAISECIKCFIKSRQCQEVKLCCCIDITLINTYALNLSLLLTITMGKTPIFVEKHWTLYSKSF